MTDEQLARLNDVVWVDPERMSGTPCFRGTRVPVQALVDHIEGNTTLEEFLEGFPSVSREQALCYVEGSSLIGEFFLDFPSVTRDQVIQFLERASS